MERGTRVRIKLFAHNLAHQLPVTVFEARIANDLKHGQMIFESVDFMLGKVGDLARIYRVGKVFLQLVHGSPVILHLVVYLLSIETQERALEPLSLFGLEIVEGEPELVVGLFKRDNLLKERKLRHLKAQQLFLFVQLFQLCLVLLDLFAHLGQSVDVLGRVWYFTILD